MRLKLLKDIRMAGAPTVQILAGSIVEASDDTARQWMGAGVAVPANYVETADLPGAETAVTAANVTTSSVTDRKREQTRERVKRFREKKALQKEASHGSEN